MKEIKEYILKNEQIEITILNVGACIKQIKYKGIECVLEYNNLNDYIDNPLCLGAVIGPGAGRISLAKFELNGVKYYLEKNDNSNNIHGGNNGLMTCFWNVDAFSNSESNKFIKLSCKLKHLAGGFPGNKKFEIVYRLDGEKVSMEILAISDKDTYTNITNHVYFNLNMDKTTKIFNHYIKVPASKFLELNEDNIPISKRSVKNTIFDLREIIKLSELDFATNENTALFGGFDHPFLIDENKACVMSEDKKIKIIIETDYPCLVIYTGNNIGNDIALNNGILSEKNLGICLEAQYEPNYMNNEFSNDYILEENNAFRKYISWNFCNEV